MQNLFVWETIGFIFVIIFGTILHFLYEWSANNKIVGIFCPVNESVWEHLKMLFFPMLLFSITEYFTVGKEYKNFIAAKSFGILLGLLFIVLFFYSFTGITGRNFLWVNILTFILGVIVAFTYSRRKITAVEANSKSNWASLLFLTALTLSFAVFTFRPPHIGLFADPTLRKTGK